MLTGLNTQVQYQGEIYHVQTEDGGISRPTITTLLFKEGAIFLSRKTSYADQIGSSAIPTLVRTLMQEQHKNMLKDLAGGKIPLPPPAPVGENEQK